MGINIFEISLRWDQNGETDPQSRPQVWCGTLTNQQPNGIRVYGHDKRMMTPNATLGRGKRPELFLTSLFYFHLQHA